MLNPYMTKESEEEREKREAMERQKQMAAALASKPEPASASAQPAARPASGGGGGQALMSAASSNPYAALAMAIIANESHQSGAGNRNEQTGDYVKELLSGEVLERDASKYLSDIPGAEFHAEMGNPEGIVKNIGKTIKKPWEWLGDLF